MREPGQNSRIQGMLDYYAKLDPAKFEEEAKKLEAMPMRERFMAGFLLYGRWGEVDPLGALEHSNTMGMGGMFVRPTILQSWASTDPAGAAKYYAEHPREFATGGFGGGRGPGGGDPNSIIAREWARQDLDGAMTWAKTLGTNSSTAMNSIISQIASSDPQKAIGLLAQVEADKRGNAYETIARSLGGKNMLDAETWIKTLPADQQNDAMAAAILGMADINPAEALKKAQSLESGDERTDALSSSFRNLAASKPQDAIAAFNTLQTDEDKSEMVQPIMQMMAMKDDASAQKWISELPAGELQDEAKMTYVRSNHSSNPQQVLSYAESIADENMRRRALGDSVRQWMQTDPEAAKAYVQSSSAFDEQAKQRLISGRGFGGGRRGQRGGGN